MRGILADIVAVPDDGVVCSTWGAGSRRRGFGLRWPSCRRRNVSRTKERGIATVRSKSRGGDAWSSSLGAGGDGGLGEAITGPSSAGQFGRLPLNFSGGSNTAADCCCWCWGRRPTGKVRPAAASLFPCDAGNFLEGRAGKTSDFRTFGQGKLRPIMLLPFYLVRAFPSEAELITSHTQLGTTCLSDQAGILCCHRLRC